MPPEPAAGLRPAVVCARLLGAMAGSEGRRARRKRNTTPDAIGLGIKRALLERAVAEDPAPAGFEAWLAERCLEAGTASGPLRAMALEVYAEWQAAVASDPFRGWLERGAPSEDAGP